MTPQALTATPETFAETAAALLREARERTLLLIRPLSEQELRAQHSALMGPILWDMGHIAHFEELWLMRNLMGPVEFGEMPGMFNPFENPRRVRGELQLPTLAETLDVLDQVRERVLTYLETVDTASDNALLRDGYVVRMVAQHEYQHNETMLQALQLKEENPYQAPRAYALPAPSRTFTGMVRFPGGRVEIGTDDRTAAYDNERPGHAVTLEPFWIDAAPVANGEFREFVEAGGYTERRWWSDAGWHWLTEAEGKGVEAPQFWERRAGGWWVRHMDQTTPVDSGKPVCHVCYHEAEAYARWAGKRLPTEPEWEAAASWNPEAGTKQIYPWGDEPPTPECANLDQLAFEAAAVGAYPRNISPIGCYGMIGDVWEWTSSDFHAYPGYETFPYKEYSELFFGPDSKVLRGGSWATRSGAIRNTFRNWDYPIRRQIFSGFRCARNDS